MSVVDLFLKVALNVRFQTIPPVELLFLKISTDLEQSILSMFGDCEKSMRRPEKSVAK